MKGHRSARFAFYKTRVVFRYPQLFCRELVACERTFTYTTNVPETGANASINHQPLTSIMSQEQYIQTLYREIQRLNLIIDRKIMIGRNYKIEAKRHKILLNKLRKHRNPGIFDRLYSVFHREYA